MPPLTSGSLITPGFFIINLHRSCTKAMGLMGIVPVREDRNRGEGLRFEV